MAFLDEEEMKFDGDKKDMGSAVRSFRYGTSIMPTAVKNVLSKLPEHLQITDPRRFDEEALMDFAANLSPTQRRDINKEIEGKGRYPSVSALLGAMEEDQTKLYNWQAAKVLELGYHGLIKYMNKRTTSGTNFHKTVEFLLAELQKTGRISDESCEKALKEKALTENYGYIKGIIPFLKKIPKTEWMTLEKATKNHYYCYQGRFDAIVEIEGEPTLVDWKTVSSDSYKHKKVNDIDRLFGVPLQVVAYIAAVNSDTKHKTIPKIKQGAVVLAYEDGREAECVFIKGDQLKKRQLILAEKLNSFWWKMFHPRKGDKDVNGNINFVFNPSTSPLIVKEDKVHDVVVLDDEVIEVTPGTSQDQKAEEDGKEEVKEAPKKLYAMFEPKKKTTTAAATKDAKQSNKKSAVFGV